MAKKNKQDRPLRPRTLRGQIIVLYILLAIINLFFLYVSFTLRHEIPKGKFEKLDGTLINFEDYDPKELGPFPKCHPHFQQHQSSEGNWVNNSIYDDKKDDPDFNYPIGHPLNKEWTKKRAKMENESKASWQSIQPSLHLLLLSCTVVYLGCKHSAWLYVIPDPTTDDAKDDDEKDEDIMQSPLQDGDAYMFPVMGSCVLFGLFVVYKYLDSDWIKYLFSCYVVVMCTNGLGINIAEGVAMVFNSRGLNKFNTLFEIPYFNFRVTIVHILAYAFSCFLGIQYIQTKHWFVNNIMGLSFCLLGLKHISIASYKTGIIMLCGLFIYDVFWVFGSTSVFGSNVMVTVATGVEAPIKLIFPRTQDGCGNLTFSMLGLGDIVVPGITISFLAKFDLSRPDAKSNPGFTYLNWTMVLYSASLITTVLVMLVFNHAQPALLYIVPYIIFSSYGTALAKGQVKDIFSFELEDTLLNIDESKKDK